MTDLVIVGQAIDINNSGDVLYSDFKIDRVNRDDSNPLGMLRFGKQNVQSPIPGCDHLGTCLDRGFSGGHEVVFVVERRAGSGFFWAQSSKAPLIAGCIMLCPTAGPALIPSGNQNKTV
jgi:hypothetical protein